jgi:Crinkler effector protein N-terminal domain
VPHPTSSSNLELNCFVHGDDPRHVFPVKIASTESVGTLKEVIKEKKKVALEHVDADALSLWKVSMAVGGDLKQKLMDMELKAGEVLSSVVRLSTVFPKHPAEGHLHVVVRPGCSGE